MQKIGVALSGGGARGIAHLGVLAALDELRIPVAHLAGVSSGAIAAAFYAAGFSPAEILRLLATTNVARLMRPAFSRYGLLRLDAVEQLFVRHLGLDATFADLKYPLTLVATDLVEGVSVYFSEGPLIPPLVASSAVPIVYRPVEYQGRQLVDGGLLNNLPVEPLLDQGLRVIGVHCNPINHAARVTNFRNLIERTLQLAINANTIPRQLRCDVLIEPPELRLYRPLGYRRAPELYEIGYRYTMSLAEQLHALV
ncbi:patatin-like phospholipase family protein [Hymenobacter fastidiosus]|uniref:Patatin-like phospholipase family protein n=1 Tax=Hymenobacter fastidiosus TaxID=486264 RepID=A0ABP7RB43_9BACT